MKLQPKIWHGIYYIDGFSNTIGNGAKMIIRSSKGGVIEQSLQFKFTGTNNKAKYETLIIGLDLAK